LWGSVASGWCGGMLRWVATRARTCGEEGCSRGRGGEGGGISGKRAGAASGRASALLSHPSAPLAAHLLARRALGGGLGVDRRKRRLCGARRQQAVGAHDALLARLELALAARAAERLDEAVGAREQGCRAASRRDEQPRQGRMCRGDKQCPWCQETAPESTAEGPAVSVCRPLAPCPRPAAHRVAMPRRALTSASSSAWRPASACAAPSTCARGRGGRQGGRTAQREWQSRANRRGAERCSQPTQAEQQAAGRRAGRAGRVRVRGAPPVRS
jgi:hypothetical protein